MTIKKLLAIREQISAKRPEFVMQDHHKRKDTQRRWRKPKGMHSKMRHGVWGRPVSVKTGYRGPLEVRGLHKSGLISILVNNMTELAAIDPKIQGVVLGNVGGKKKTELLNACKQKSITVFNVKNIDEEIKNLTGKFSARKEAKKLKAQRKQTSKAAPKKEAKKEETVTKEQERKEMEKVLTQKEA